MSIDFQRVLPVIVSILIIIGVAILRNYSKTFAAIAATMPINIPLALWIVYAGDNAQPAKMADFTQSLMFNIFPTVFFIAAALLAFRAGWTLVPTLVIGYVAWGITLALTMLLRQWLGL